jgi:hypothetical protein
MANIFKTTLKKDIIADIANNNIREIRFPITKFWATRLADKYSLNEKTFEFKTFDTLELSSPSNKDTDAMTYVFGFNRTYVDNDEFVVCFCDITDEVNDEVQETNDIEQIEFPQIEEIEVDNVDFIETLDLTPNDDFYTYDRSDVNFSTNNDEVKILTNNGEIKELDKVLDKELDDIYFISNKDVCDSLKIWFEKDKILDTFYEDENVFATNAIQVIVLPNGKVLGFKKSLPVNNDVEVRIEFDKSDKVYFDTTKGSDEFKEVVLNTLNNIRKNNFVFIWKRYTGIFVDRNNRVYFGIKYSTRKSIGFNRKYNVQ